MLKLKDISKSYVNGGFVQKALDGVSLNFRESEFVAVLGPSGSGKTTFLNVIGGLDKHDSGDLIINGKSTSKFRDPDWDAYRNNSIGFIFQSYNLITHLSNLENVEIGMTLSGVSISARKSKAAEVLKRVGLEDHMHKKPNQLSGGQMQRVAIARALANDPDIILADEPTGNLDSHTSDQIMDLIKEISKDKLVIMVTHNVELANKYADRVVNFFDGRVVDDTNPFADKALSAGYLIKRTSMSFMTALKMSGRNIATKKWRTAITAFAASIGIIGIALILSLSNGFDKQIQAFEAGTLSGFPITITQTVMETDINQTAQRRLRSLASRVDNNEYPDQTYLTPYNPRENRRVHINVFTDDYIEYIEGIDERLLSGFSYTRRVNMNILRSDGDRAENVNTSAIRFSPYPSRIDSNTPGYLETAYDLLAGSYPSGLQDLVLVVDSYNRVGISILDALGFDAGVESIGFDDILGYELKLILNDTYYVLAGDVYVINGNPSNLISMYESDEAITLRITGVIRAKQETLMPIISPGIAYRDELSLLFIEDAKNSEIVMAQTEADYNILTGQSFPVTTGPSRSSATGSAKDIMLERLGAEHTPYMISLYPKDFESKDKVLDYLEAWNEGKEAEDIVIYTDMAQTFVDLSGNIMGGITMVLIAFAAISLVVSLIMIGIITYISVLERTREIGVLRALGARKKDITRVFNAETFIVGSCSGLLGIIIAQLLVFPINFVLKRLTDLSDVAQLNVLHALMLVALSVTLTMLGGLIPSKMAAKKDPVAALRAE